MRIDKCEPGDAEVKTHLDLRDQLDAMEYDWVDTKIVGSSSVMRSEVVIDDAGIMVGDPLEWSILPVGPKERICSSFDDYVIPLYECLFTRIRLCLPFYSFEVVVLKHLKVRIPNFIWVMGVYKGIPFVCQTYISGTFPYVIL